VLGRGPRKERAWRANLPPMKCRPLKCFTSGFGAVRLTSTAGWNLLPTPEAGGPSSILQEDGASTEVTGSFVSSRAWMTAENGSLTSPEKLKPMLSRQRSPGHTRRPPRIRTEDGIHNVVSGLQGVGEIIDEGDLEIFQLLGKPLRTR
jgi:hypothetical protein